MNYELVLFDFDGTLANSFPAFVGMTNEAARRFGFRRVEASEVERLRGSSAREIIQTLGVPRWKVPLIAIYMRRRMGKEIEQVALFEGVTEMIQRLAEEGVSLAVVSSNSEANVRRVLCAETAARIQSYACGVSLFGKAALFRKIVEQSGVGPEKVIAIGDEIRDIEAAKQAGIASGAVAWGFTTVAALAAQRPTELFASIEEMEATLAPLTEA